MFFRQFCVTGIFINFYSSRIFQIFREFLRDYVYVYIYIYLCVCMFEKIELFYFALSEKCLSKILAIRNFITVFLRFHNFLKKKLYLSYASRLSQILFEINLIGVSAIFYVLNIFFFSSSSSET